MRVLVAAMGSRGDVQPGLLLARALRDAGHEVRASAPPDFEGLAAQLGLPFQSAGSSVQEIVRKHAAGSGNPFKLMRAVREILLQELPAMTSRLQEAAEGMDAIVSCNQLMARTVAEAAGIPRLGVMYSPTLKPSAHHAPFMARWHSAPPAVNRITWKLTDRFGSPMFMDAIDAQRRKLALAPVKSFAEYLFSGTPYMLACDAVVGPVPPDWAPGEITPVGPFFYDDPAPLPDDVESFLASGPPPVFVGFGSMASTDPAAATRAIVAGAGSGGRRVLLSQGWAGFGEGAGSERVKVVVGPLPHAKLFPRVAAVVHHGGSGTTSAALRAGVPQVVVPHLADQFYFAHRLKVLGIAPGYFSVQHLTPRRLAHVVDATLALPPGPRLAAAERLRPADGLARAVAFVERRLAPKG